MTLLGCLRRRVTGCAWCSVHASTISPSRVPPRRWKSGACSAWQRLAMSQLQVQQLRSTRGRSTDMPPEGAHPTPCDDADLADSLSFVQASYRAWLGGSLSSRLVHGALAPRVLVLLSLLLCG